MSNSITIRNSGVHTPLAMSKDEDIPEVSTDTKDNIVAFAEIIFKNSHERFVDFQQNFRTFQLDMFNIISKINRVVTYGSTKFESEKSIRNELGKKINSFIAIMETNNKLVILNHQDKKEANTLIKNIKEIDYNEKYFVRDFSCERKSQVESYLNTVEQDLSKIPEKKTRIFSAQNSQKKITGLLPGFVSLSLDHLRNVVSVSLDNLRNVVTNRYFFFGAVSGATLSLTIQNYYRIKKLEHHPG